MTRLTNEIREHISRQAVAAAFNQRFDAMAAAEDALAREAYADVFSEAERAMASQMPGYWLRRDPCLNFNAGGYRIKLCTTADHLPVPYQGKGDDHGYHCRSSQGTIKDQDLSDRIRAHATAKEALSDEKKRVARSLSQMLQSVNSIKRLKEVWPEGQPFYARYLESKAFAPPAIRMDEINAALGLAPVAA